MPPNIAVWAGVVLGFSAAISMLGPSLTWRAYLFRTCVTTAIFCILIGLGAVFGKVLGDFLRGVN